MTPTVSSAVNLFLTKSTTVDVEPFSSRLPFPNPLKYIQNTSENPSLGRYCSNLP